MARAMKDSGIEWIGEIPEGWEMRKGKSLYAISTGKLDANAEDIDGKYPFFTCSMYPKRINTYAFDCEALLVAGNGLVGFTQYYVGKFNAYQRTYVLSNFAGINPNYLRLYVTNNLMLELESKSVGSVIQFIKLGDLQNFNIVFPASFEEQKKIVVFLEKECNHIDTVIEQTRASIEEYKKLKQSVITQAVTKGIRPGRKMKDSGVEWIGEIPEEWKVEKLKYSIQWKSEKGQPDATVLSLYRDYGVIPKDSRDDNHNVTSLDTSTYKVVNQGDFVINKMKAWQGSMAVSEYDGIVSPAYHVCQIANDEILKKYLHHLLRNQLYLPEYRRLSTGMRIGQWDLGYDDFKNLPFILPPMEEQIEIVNYIEQKCKDIDKLIEAKEQYLTELESYKKSLIFEYVTGKKEVV